MDDEATLDFFYDAGSCSLAVRTVLEEGDFAYTAHRVTARDGDRDTRRAEWLARNPKGRVPALSPVPGRAGGEDGLLTEVPAILGYLAALRPDLDLMPSDPARAARTSEWLNWLSGWVHAVSFAQLWRPERFSDDPATFDAVRRKGRENLRNAFGAIERIFADGRPWAVLDRFTVVDAFPRRLPPMGRPGRLRDEPIPGMDVIVPIDTGKARRGEGTARGRIDLLRLSSRRPATFAWVLAGAPTVETVAGRSERRRIVDHPRP